MNRYTMEQMSLNEVALTSKSINSLANRVYYKNTHQILLKTGILDQFS